MAILKCKMCGGTLDYDRQQNLAVCPYCGSRSTLLDYDRKLLEQFREQFAALLDQEPAAVPAEGFWVEASREELIREDGEVIEITYLVKRQVDLCMMYAARNHVIYVFQSQHAGYADRYQEMTGRIAYPSREMGQELSSYVPKIVTRCRLADGSLFLAVEKAAGVYPLDMLGTLLDRHVAWVVSRLENLCCLLDYNDMVLNGFTAENLFVDPANHQIYLYGGWWFAGFQGAECAGASGDVKQYLEKGRGLGRYPGQAEKSRNRKRTDLESIRLAAARLLGYPDRESLRGDKTLPKPFREFLIQGPERDARADFAKWDWVLLASYGERKFIPLSVTEEEVYSRSAFPERGSSDEER